MQNIIDSNWLEESNQASNKNYNDRLKRNNGIYGSSDPKVIGHLRKLEWLRIEKLELEMRVMRENIQKNNLMDFANPESFIAHLLNIPTEIEKSKTLIKKYNYLLFTLRKTEEIAY